MPSPRILSWFSCGAASAVASKFTVGDYGDNNVVEVVYCDVIDSEHPDNWRFLRDVENWLDQKVTIIKSKKYDSVDDVFERERYMSGIAGARCTKEMKKIPRYDFQRPDDIHVFGFTLDEPKRIATFEANNFELNLDWPLVRHNTTKKDCYQILLDAGIRLPEMYLLGYKNNNCLGCVKATSPAYWNKVREDFPETFEKRASQSREIGCKLTRIKSKRIFLDELPIGNYGRYKLEDISCGPECHGGD